MDIRQARANHVKKTCRYEDGKFSYWDDQGG